MTKRKTRKQVKIVNAIVKAVSGPRILAVATRSSLTEYAVRLTIHGDLLAAVERIYATLSPTVSEARNKWKAERSVIIETDATTVINNFELFGTQHRPDFEVTVDGTRIAIEVKVGDSGKQIREGIGQAIVYSTQYDFVVYLFVDKSPNKRILSSSTMHTEMQLVEQLWSEFNVRFKVV